MALVNVKKDNRVLTIDERELERYLEDGYEQVRYDNRNGTYKTVTQKKTVNDAEFAEELSPQAAERDAMNPLSDVELGSEISPTEAAKLGGTSADVARAAGADTPHVMRNGNVTAPSGAHEMEFGAELTPEDMSPAGAEPQAAPNADYSGEFGAEVAPDPAAKTARKRKQ